MPEQGKEQSQNANSQPVPVQLLQVQYIQRGSQVYKVLVPSKVASENNQDSDNQSILPETEPNPIICKVQPVQQFSEEMKTLGETSACNITTASFSALTDKFSNITSLVKLPVEPTQTTNSTSILSTVNHAPPSCGRVPLPETTNNSSLLQENPVSLVPTSPQISPSASVQSPVCVPLAAPVIPLVNSSPISAPNVNGNQATVSTTAFTSTTTTVTPCNPPPLQFRVNIDSTGKMTISPEAVKMPSALASVNVTDSLKNPVVSTGINHNMKSGPETLFTTSTPRMTSPQLIGQPYPAFVIGSSSQTVTSTSSSLQGSTVADLLRGIRSNTSNSLSHPLSSNLNAAKNNSTVPNMAKLKVPSILKRSVKYPTVQPKPALLVGPVRPLMLSNGAVLVPSVPNNAMTMNNSVVIGPCVVPSNGLQPSAVPTVVSPTPNGSTLLSSSLNTTAATTSSQSTACTSSTIPQVIYVLPPALQRAPSTQAEPRTTVPAATLKATASINTSPQVIWVQAPENSSGKTVVRLGSTSTQQATTTFTTCINKCTSSAGTNLMTSSQLNSALGSGVPVNIQVKTEPGVTSQQNTNNNNSTTNVLACPPLPTSVAPSMPRIIMASRQKAETTTSIPASSLPLNAVAGILRNIGPNTNKAVHPPIIMNKKPVSAVKSPEMSVSKTSVITLTSVEPMFIKCDPSNWSFTNDRKDDIKETSQRNKTCLTREELKKLEQRLTPLVVSKSESPKTYERKTLLLESGNQGVPASVSSESNIRVRISSGQLSTIKQRLEDLKQANKGEKRDPQHMVYWQSFKRPSGSLLKTFPQVGSRILHPMQVNKTVQQGQAPIMSTGHIPAPSLTVPRPLKLKVTDNSTFLKNITNSILPPPPPLKKFVLSDPQSSLPNSKEAAKTLAPNSSVISSVVATKLQKISSELESKGAKGSDLEVKDVANLNSDKSPPQIDMCDEDVDMHLFEPEVILNEDVEDTEQASILKASLEKNSPQKTEASVTQQVPGIDAHNVSGMKIKVLKMNPNAKVLSSQKVQIMPQKVQLMPQKKVNSPQQANSNSKVKFGLKIVGDQQNPLKTLSPTKIRYFYAKRKLDMLLEKNSTKKRKIDTEVNSIKDLSKEAVSKSEDQSKTVSSVSPVHESSEKSNKELEGNLDKDARATEDGMLNSKESNALVCKNKEADKVDQKDEKGSKETKEFEGKNLQQSLASEEHSNAESVELCKNTAEVEPAAEVTDNEVPSTSCNVEKCNDASNSLEEKNKSSQSPLLLKVKLEKQHRKKCKHSSTSKSNAKQGLGVKLEKQHRKKCKHLSARKSSAKQVVAVKCKEKQVETIESSSVHQKVPTEKTMSFRGVPLSSDNCAGGLLSPCYVVLERIDKNMILSETVIVSKMDLERWNKPVLSRSLKHELKKKSKTGISSTLAQNNEDSKIPAKSTGERLDALTESTRATSRKMDITSSKLDSVLALINKKKETLNSIRQKYAK